MANDIPSHIQMEYVPCPIGCKPNDTIVLTGSDRIYNLPGTFTLMRCNTCDLMRTNPRPTQDTIKFYYPKNYQPYVKSKINKPDLPLGNTHKILLHLQEKILRTYTRVIPHVKPGRMLEIGCASGNYLYRMASMGWEVSGIEFSEEAGNEARKLGYPIHIGPIESAPEPNEKYNLITAWMVIEHVHEPVKTLMRLASWCAPDAWIVVSIPDVSTFWHKLVKNRSFDLQLPTHLFHYTPKIIEKVLSASGFETERIFYQKTLRTIMPTIANILSERLNSNNKVVKWFNEFSNFGPAVQLIFYPLSFILGISRLTGRMTVWATIKK